MEQFIVRAQDAATNFAPWSSTINDSGPGFEGVSVHDSALTDTAITASGSVTYTGQGPAFGYFENRIDVLFTVDATTEATLTGLIDSAGEVNGEENFVEVILRDETTPPGFVAFGADTFLGPLMLDRALLLTEGRSYRLIVSLGGEYFGPSAVSSSYSIELGVPPVCEADNDADGDVDVFDLLSYLDSWFNLDASAERTGDIPVSINVFDLLAYLDEWFAGC